MQSLKPNHDGGEGSVPFAGRGERPVHRDVEVVDPGMSPSRRSVAAKAAAARIGPTVCELDGPTPMEKRSNTLTVMGLAVQGSRVSTATE